MKKFLMNARANTQANTALLILQLLIFILTLTSGGSEICKIDEFKCIKTGQCIQNKFKCDGYFDCIDKSDEKDCPADRCSLKTDVFHCKTPNTSCIPLEFKCDSLPDCKDQSDEEDCEKTKCPSGMFTCLTSGKCIHQEWKCDDAKDCPDGSDETNCTGVVFPAKPSVVCNSNQFQCNDTKVGQCIKRKWVCDGHEDCFDGSDELEGCVRENCDEKNEFRCRDGTCILNSFVCNGIDDCYDGDTQQVTGSSGIAMFTNTKSSDEDGSICHTEKKCKVDEYLCSASKECIPLYKLCDYRADCADKSDEGQFCRHYCKEKCPDNAQCQPLPNGTTCICNGSGYRYRNGKCEDINECETNNGGCQHICINIVGSHKCQCVSDDYQLEKGMTCRYKNAEKDDLILVDVKNIHRYSLRDNYMYELVTNLVRGVALDYDLKAGRIFYSDVTRNAIYSSYVQRNRKNVTKADTIIDKGLAVPDGIAIDWIAKVVYFTESSANRIDVSSFDGKKRASLISSNVTSPRGLALDPRMGYLFITDWGGEARILRTQMDGSSMKTLVTEKVGWPNGITVDYNSKRVYWIDARYDYIDSINYDGGDRRTLIKGNNYVPHAFALTMDDSYIYFTDWMKKGVVRVNKTSGMQDYTVLVKNLTRPMDIHVMSESRQPDAVNPCETKNPGCVHMCVIKNSTSASCLCQIGSVLDKNGKSCKPVEKFLIFARSWEVRGISLDLSYRHDVMTPVLDLSSAVGTDFYAQDEYVFFSDIKADRIGRVNIENQSSLVWLHTEYLENPDGLAVDWIGKNLYWTDTKVNTRSEIGVSSLDGKYRRTLYNENLGKPRAIVVDPNRGYLFYTDWLAPAKIGRLDMDGRNQKILVNGLNISWPNGLAIDSLRLYWADAKFDRIESINFDGSDRKIVIPSTQHTFGLAVDDEYIYWSDWLAKSIHRVPKMRTGTNSTSHQYVRQDYSGLMEIQIYDRSLQVVNKTMRDQAICLKLGCQQLCLLKPNNKAVCACAQNMNISRVDNKTCINTANHTSPKPFKCYLPGYWKCATQNKCIKESWKCDGFADCTDKSDESFAICMNATCSEQRFKCNNSYRCIPNEWKCDSTNDCTDGSDEVNCNNGGVSCKNTKDFHCKDGKQCIERRYQCDGERDCEDGSDEIECDKPNRCDEFYEFQCKTKGGDGTDSQQRGPCIPKTWVCDRHGDCKDKSDELPNFCSNKSAHGTPPGYFKCGNGKILKDTYVCDERDDCGDGTDERCAKHVNYCEPAVFVNASAKLPDAPNMNCTCLSGEFRCKDSKRCIKDRSRCDFEKDCDDFSDEMNCHDDNKCKVTEFECANRMCIDISHQCDGKDDCKDAKDGKLSSDEIGCHEVKKECIRGKDFFCDLTQKTCIHLSSACNKKNDCPNATDEGPGCNLASCRFDNGNCEQLCHTTPAGAMCGCQPGYNLANDSKHCIDIDECAGSQEICTHQCYNSKGSYVCKCNHGFTLRADGHTCTAGGPDPVIVFSDHKEVRILDPKTGETKTLVSGLKSAIGVDFHFAENRIYWSDVSKDKIERINIDGTGREEIITQGMNSPEGIAIDWVANNIYWTDMRLDTIEAAHVDGSNRSVILSQGLDAPRALALDPGSGYMFWTDWGKKSRIERADMDGGNRLILTDTNVVWPNGLTVDLATKRIYFVDARLDTLDVMEYDGSKRRTILKSGLIKHPFALAVFEDYAYFTDWTPGSIRRLSRRDGASKFIYSDQLKKPMGIQVMHPSKQPIDITYPNYCANATCSHLCLLKPGGFSCKCPFGYQLKDDDNTSCVSVEEFLIYARRQEIRGISLNPNDTVDKITPITGTQNAIGVDFHYRKQLIYWTDVSKDSISRISVQGVHREDIIPSGLPAPDGLAVDWIADNLYWTDADRDRIEVARLDGRYRKVIISSGMQQPRGIELVPQEGIMIWTDWGENKIEFAHLDGSNRMDLVNESVGYPNGVSYDFKTRRVFWCDAKTDKIEYIELFPLHGVKKRGEVKIAKGGIVHPFGITVFNGYIYWTDWGKRAILRTNMNGTEITSMRSPHLSLMGLRIYHKDKQTGNNTCWNKTLCSHLCFAISRTEYKCGCATGYELDPTDKRTCRGAKSFLLYSTTTEVRAMSFEKNPESESIVPILGLKSSYAIDYHFVNGTIYIVDDNKDTVFRVKQDGSQLEPIITTGLDRPQGVAVDWVSENLYWTDAGTSLLEVSRLDGSHRLILINTQIDSPRAIMVYPQKGYLFWTDWGSQDPKVERASLTGEDRVVLVNESILKQNRIGTQIGWPNGLTLDYATETIYWLDAKYDVLVKMDINGKNITILLQESRIIKHPYSITFFKDYLYWTDWHHNAVMKMPLDGKKNFSYVRRNLENIRDLHAYDQSRQLPVENHPCENNNGGCEQLCLAYPSGNKLKRKCFCSSGTLSPNGISCENVEDYLIFAKRNEIQFLDLNPRRRLSSPRPPIQSLYNAVGIDYDYENGVIYYSDIYSKEIGRIGIDGKNKEVLVRNLKSPDGVAYDWVNHQLYWTDALENTVNRLKGKTKEVLVHKELDEPRAIALSPCDGFMYWTDWGRPPYIKHATMDGHNPKVIVSDKLGWPNGLTVDMNTSRIYWADARLDRIESADLDGKNRRIIVQDAPHVFGVTLFGDYIYWTDWVTRSVTRINKFGRGAQVVLIDRLDAQPMGIRVYSQSRQNCSRTPCYNNGGKCSDLCNVRDGKAVCSCVPPKTLMDGYRCVSPAKAGLTCNLNTSFLCSDGLNCVLRPFVCDGDPDCHDKSDENPLTCKQHKCSINQFSCYGTGKCIPNDWRCDSEKDCKDGSDEFNCPRKKNCTQDEFKCWNNKCVARVFRCDGSDDCGDRSDEQNCPSTTCRPGFFKCKTVSDCIRKSYVCDGYNDCSDNSDELKENCIHVNCTSKEFKCSDQKKCIPKAWRCDEDEDCADGSDEKNCESKLNCSQTTDFTCKSGECILKQFQCDGDKDCSDGSDEDVELCVDKKCESSDQFKCANSSNCIPMRYICDGDNDCVDGSDEALYHGCKLKTCKEDEFKCKNNHVCIPKSWKCDNENDCGDNSDEIGCTCEGDNKFKCSSGECLAASVKCDGKDDCKDKSDESKCGGEECQTYKCLIKGKMTCVDDEKICNGLFDCDDAIDEKLCDRNECMELPKKCQHICIDQKQGYKCKCHPSFFLQSDNRTCSHTCSDYQYHKCSQICILLDSVSNAGNLTRLCQCAPGYTLEKNMVSCKHNTEVRPYLVLANKQFVNSLSIYEKPTYGIMHIVEGRIKAIDFDAHSNWIFWIQSNGGIFYSNITKPSPKNLVKHDLPQPLDLTVDWITGNVYFTEASKNSIYVINVDSKQRKTILTDKAHPPNTIVCHPSSGYLYYTTTEGRSQATISRVGMDGTKPKVFIIKNLKTPQGLAIDHVTGTLYWSDVGLKRIEYIRLKSGVRRVLMHTAGPSPTLSVFEDFVYYSLVGPESGVFKAHRWTGQNKTTMRKSKVFEKYTDLSVFHSLRQPRIRNLCTKAQCSHLCLLSPGGQHTCACGDHYTIAAGSKACITTCSTDQFQCPNFKCISRDWLCDKENDCGDNPPSDEKNCGPFKCPSDNFQCLNGNCTRKFFICDGENDCGDNSDERNCEKRDCFHFQFRCNNHRCIMRSRKCDGKDDCGDNSDEENDECKDALKCTKNQFQCDKDKCIPNAWKCDGTLDCRDGSDETNSTCLNHTCPALHFKCRNGRCIMENWKCDGDDDCSDHSDEDQEECRNHNCDPKSSFICDKNQCKSNTWRCDGERDCLDGADEENCKDSGCNGNDNFKCKNGNCITSKWRCDGDNDCGDNSDEDPSFCSKVSCKADEFKCDKSSTCIPQEWKCDKIVDCADRSDEKYCQHVTQCSSDEFQCTNGTCVRLDWVCDGVKDCFDGSDEIADTCRYHECNPDTHFECSNGQQYSLCIPKFKRCDGTFDCPNKNDEANCGRPCEPNKFKCKYGECIDNAQVCDFSEDCSNGIDERNCDKKDETLSCEKHCSGLRCTMVGNNQWLNCTCKQGYEFKMGDYGRECVDVNECEKSPHLCEQQCVNLAGSYKCRCVNGYNLNTVSGHCKVKGHAPLLIVPTENNLMIASVNKINNKTRPVTFKTEVSHLLEGKATMEISYGADRLLLLGDRNKMSIEGFSYAVSLFTPTMSGRIRRETEPLYTSVFTITGVSPEHLAVDFIGGNLLWVDNSKQPTINIGDMKGKYHGTIISRNTGNRKIEGLALDPPKGFVYWSEIYGNYIFPKIYRAQLNGEKIKELVTDKLEYPVALTVDIPSGRLFWADMKKHSVESVEDINGGLRVVAVDSKRDSRLQFPMAIDVFEDYVYGIMKYTGMLFKVHKFGRKRMTILKADLRKTFQLRMFHFNRHLPPSEKFVNPCENHYCPQICVPVNGKAKCLCFEQGNCEQEKCDSKFCNNRGTCNETSNGYTCNCLPRFTGRQCGEKCQYDCQHGRCERSDQLLGLYCKCDKGYTGNSCQNATCEGFKCSDRKTCYVEDNKHMCRCEENCKAAIQSADKKTIIIAVVVVILVLLIIVIVVIIFIKRRREYNQFAPKRMNTIEMENPAFANEGEYFNDYDDPGILPSKKTRLPDLYDKTPIYESDDDDDNEDDDDYRGTSGFMEDYNETTKLVDI